MSRQNSPPPMGRPAATAQRRKASGAAVFLGCGLAFVLMLAAAWFYFLGGLTSAPPPTRFPSQDNAPRAVSSRPPVPREPRLRPLRLAQARALPFAQKRRSSRFLRPWLLPRRVASWRGRMRYADLHLRSEKPVRGALLVRDHKGRRKHTLVLHDPLAAMALKGDWVAVLSSSGIWLHEGKTLVRRALLVPAYVNAMATSPAGDRLAYVTQMGRRTRLHVVSWPKLKKLRTMRGWPARRMRFSPDGKRLVLASHAKDAVIVANVETGKQTRIKWTDDPKDVTFLAGHPDLIGIVDDEDIASIYNLKTRKVVFTSVARVNRYHRAYGGFHRDQNAVAFDPNTQMFFHGGDENIVWRYQGLVKGRPQRELVPQESKGNVQEIVISSTGQVVVARDSSAIEVLDHKGRVVNRLGPFLSNTASSYMRVSPAPQGDIFAVVLSCVLRWSPTTNALVFSSEYRMRSWSTKTFSKETILYRCGASSKQHNNAPWEAQTCTIQRVPHRSPSPDVQAEFVGRFFTHLNLKVLRDNKRLVFVGQDPKGHLRMAFLRPGQRLSKAVQTDIPFAGAYAKAPRRQAIGHVTKAGVIYELNSRHKSWRFVRRFRRPLKFGDSLIWSRRAKGWTISNPFGR